MAKAARNRSSVAASEEPKPKPTKAARLYEALKGAEEDLYVALRSAGLFDDQERAALRSAAYRESGSLPDRDLGTTPVQRLLWRFTSAHEKVVSFHENRIRQLENALRKTVEQPNAATALVALYGPTGRRRNPHVLLDAERRMIDDHRRMDPAGRQMIRVLFQRLARTSKRTSRAQKGGA